MGIILNEKLPPLPRLCALEVSLRPLLGRECQSCLPALASQVTLQQSRLLPVGPLDAHTVPTCVRANSLAPHLRIHSLHSSPPSQRQQQTTGNPAASHVLPVLGNARHSLAHSPESEIWAAASIPLLMAEAAGKQRSGQIMDSRDV